MRLSRPSGPRRPGTGSRRRGAGQGPKPPPPPLRALVRPPPHVQCPSSRSGPPNVHAPSPTPASLCPPPPPKAGIKVLHEGAVDGRTIAEKGLIDRHYYAIARRASLHKPGPDTLPADLREEFARRFGVEWEAALAQGLVCNAVDACARLGLEGDQLAVAWAGAKRTGQLIKCGGGFYLGLVLKPDTSPGGPASALSWVLLHRLLHKFYLKR